MEPLDRRSFLAGTGAAAAPIAAPARVSALDPPSPVFLSTWEFGCGYNADDAAGAHPQPVTAT